MMKTVLKSFTVFCGLLFLIVIQGGIADLPVIDTANVDSPNKLKEILSDRHDSREIQAINPNAFIASPFPAGSQLPRGFNPLEQNLLPPSKVTLGHLDRKERLGFLLVNEFGGKGAQYEDELWYRFANTAFRGLEHRRIPTAFARPAFPKGFHNEREIDEHMNKVFLEEELEAKMLARVDDLAVRYMDDVISDFELQRGTDLEKKRAEFASRLNIEFGTIDSSYLNKMWYHYRMPIYAKEMTMMVRPSFQEPILPAGFHDEIEFQGYISSIHRDGGKNSLIARRTEQLAASYMENIIALTPSEPESCNDRCYEKYNRSHTGCNCNKECTTHRDCCPDFREVCQEMRFCRGRCFNNFDTLLPCQCDYQCIEKRNCCADFLSDCLSDYQAAEHLEIKPIMENNEAFKRLVDEFQSSHPTNLYFSLERKFYPQCAAGACENTKLDYILRDDLADLRNLLKLDWIKIMTTSNDDLLVSSDAKEAIIQGSNDGWGLESFSTVQPPIKEANIMHPNTIFFQYGFYRAMDKFLSMLCQYRQCNVGICKISPLEYSEDRRQKASHLLKEYWLSQEFGQIETRYFDDGGDIQNDFANQNRYLFDIWTYYFCAIEDIYGVSEFLLQYPNQKALDIVLGRYSYCQCIDNFHGPSCDNCPEN